MASWPHPDLGAATTERMAKVCLQLPLQSRETSLLKYRRKVAEGSPLPPIRDQTSVSVEFPRPSSHLPVQ